MQRKILIADDEPFLRTLMQQALEDLEDEGVELLIASNGEEALKTIQSEKPDLVFLDVMMPRKSGFDVCQAVRNSPDTRSTYIVLLTAKGQEVDRHRGLELGADLYMTKPFDPDVLIEKARQVLSNLKPT
jgi:two-component system, OmpR family, alkaline phosphatase synthesis response regulator PhoP